MRVGGDRCSRGGWDGAGFDAPLSLQSCSKPHYRNRCRNLVGLTSRRFRKGGGIRVKVPAVFATGCFSVRLQPFDPFYRKRRGTPALAREASGVDASWILSGAANSRFTKPAVPG